MIGESSQINSQAVKAGSQLSFLRNAPLICLPAFMYLGELIECGKTKDVLEQPSQQRTKDYVTGKIG
ncbi:hypothetical protein IQ238_27950 [Pleurocapsales cyanobacterium LEGE 06147]|nr:hypothetical protein [Pleurocapsales cyanobacterium LEGE 06147]